MSNIFLKRKLGDTVGVKSENLQIMRFVAVLMVIVSNSFFICFGTDEGELLFRITNNQITMREVALSLFFLCSGYLIAQSVDRHKTAKEFFSLRWNRLFSSAVFVTVAILVICNFVSTWKPAGYIVSTDTWKYLLNSVFLYVRELPGVFGDHPTTIVNTAYGTLMLGIICCVLCFIAYKLGFFDKKRYLISVPLVMIAGAVVWKYSVTYVMLWAMFRMLLLFYIGVGYWVYRDDIVLDIRCFVIACVAFVILLALGAGMLAMWIAFPYMIIYISFGIKQCPEKLGKLGDYSYGIFLWGFFVQQLVYELAKADAMLPKTNALIALPISILLGIFTYEVIANKAKDVPAWIKELNCPDIVYVVLLILYSMRHVNWGLDLADTGYSYSNFQYMSFEHMDSMWMFSTYLANGIGNILTKLPFANTLLGMNFYTTLFVAVLAVIGYLFCTRTLKMNRWVVFVAELVTLALSWCPSAALYNYITYILVVLCVIFLYRGLTKDKKWWLFAAGICLGANILTRFSNLPQAALILAVWAYGFMESKERAQKGALKETINRTLWCIGGWLTGFGSFMLYIHIRYGIDEYIEGIVRLFAMTEVAEGYTPTGMLDIVNMQLSEQLPWLVDLGEYMLAGLLAWAVIAWMQSGIRFVRERAYIQRGLQVAGIAYSIYLGREVVEKLYYGDFCKMNYFAYSSIQGPAIVLMMITAVIVIVKLVSPKVDKDEKLISLMVLLLLFINSLGSSNGLFSSFNNLCLAAPYTMWNIYRYVRSAKDIVIAKASISTWPVKTVLIAFLYVLFWQAGLFGQYFFFTEATGAQEVVATVENNEVLKGIKMHPHKAEWLTSLSKHVNDYDLEGREVILYGNVPALSFYLQMPPAFNSWPDLGSYNIKKMTADMLELEGQIYMNEIEPPLVIVEATISQNQNDPKWNLILDFMEKHNYECTFYNGKLLMYEPMLSE